MAPITSPRVAFAPVLRSIRPPRDDELSVMRTFTRHASHCHQCADPYYVWKTNGELCNRGHAYACDVAKYIYSKGGRPHSVIDKESRNERNEIEVPVDCEVIHNLTKAFHQGLNPKSKKPVVSHDYNYYGLDRKPRNRDERPTCDSLRDYGIKISPSQRQERERYPREERDTRDRKRATVHIDNKGNLYHLNEFDKQSRRRYKDESVILLTEPSGRRRYIR